MSQKGFASIALIVLAIVFVGAAGYLTLAKKPIPFAAHNATVHWKTYRNEKFGFDFKYPAELQVVSSGPNEEQKKLDSGKTISGTIPPSYDTITFSNSAKKDQFNVIIFSVSKNEVSPVGFKGYLSIGSVCDTRWIDSFSGEPTLLNKNGIPILEVQVISGGPKGGNSAGCYYFKNSKGNLIAFNVSGFEKISDFSNAFHLVGDKILSTLKFLDENAEGKFCGGIAANLPEYQCPSGYKCQLNTNYPDAGGKCVKQ